jgi:hypothetical protein
VVHTTPCRSLPAPPFAGARPRRRCPELARAIPGRSSPAQPLLGGCPRRLGRGARVGPWRPRPSSSYLTASTAWSKYAVVRAENQRSRTTPSTASPGAHPLGKRGGRPVGLHPAGATVGGLGTASLWPGRSSVREHSRLLEHGRRGGTSWSGGHLRAERSVSVMERWVESLTIFSRADGRRRY